MHHRRRRRKGTQQPFPISNGDAASAGNIVNPNNGSAGEGASNSEHGNLESAADQSDGNAVDEEVSSNMRQQPNGGNSYPPQMMQQAYQHSENNSNLQPSTLYNPTYMNHNVIHQATSINDNPFIQPQPSGLYNYQSSTSRDQAVPSYFVQPPKIRDITEYGITSEK